MANVPGMGDYSELLAATAGARNQVSIKAEDIANAHRSALEMTKTLGEVKSYLSGRNITKKLFENISKTKPADLSKVGIDGAEAQANYDAALNAAGREAQSLVQGAKESVEGLFTKTPAVRVGNPGEVANPAFDSRAFDNEIPNPAFEGSQSVSDAVAGANPGDLAKPITQVSDQLADNLAETSFGSTVRQTIGSAINKSGKFVKAGEGAGAEGGGVVEGTEAVSSVLDGIPGVDILGVILGGAAALYGGLHHVKEPKPSDGVHITTQVGVE